MSNQLIPFGSDTLPAYLADAAGAAALLNKDVASAAAFPTMSIMGKRFTVSRDGIKKVLTKPGEDDEVAQNIGIVILRANMNAKVFYAKKYSNGDSDGARPDCYSLDGVAPSDNSPHKQSNKCAICAHNQWGSRIDDRDEGGEKKGRACADNARLAISAPDKTDPMLLRVPPASLKNLREAVKLINQRKIPYNAVVMKVGFDIDAASPKLTFKPIGLLPDGMYAESKEAYDSEQVRAIVGADDVGVEHEVVAKPAVDADELDAAIAAKAVTDKAAVVVKPAPAPALAPVKPKPAPVAKAPAVELDELADLVAPPAATAPVAPAKAAPTVSSSASDLLNDLDSLLGATDD